MAREIPFERVVGLYLPEGVKWVRSCPMQIPVGEFPTGRAWLCPLPALSATLPTNTSMIVKALRDEADRLARHMEVIDQIGDLERR